jgi:cobalt-zinc-cadmium efflux system membrane fusion protein
MTITLNKQQHQDRPSQIPTRLRRIAAAALLLALTLSGCKHDAAPASAGAPPSSVQVEEIGGSNLVHADGTSRFSLVPTASREVRSTLQVTGSVNPDVSREIPVLSLANGRVIALHVGLGDYVHKGQLVMEVQSPDVSTAFNAYLKAVNDEHLPAVDVLGLFEGIHAGLELDVLVIDEPVDRLLVGQVAR